MIPFEVDAGNRPHLFKHVANDEGRSIGLGEADVMDVYLDGQPFFYPADMSKGEAHWIMVGIIPGIVVAVPLAPPKSGDPTKCRPIGVYQASQTLRERYIEEMTHES